MVVMKYLEELKKAAQEYGKYIDMQAYMTEEIQEALFDKNFRIAQDFLSKVDEEDKLRFYLDIENLRNIFLYKIVEENEKLVFKTISVQEIEEVLQKKEVFVNAEEAGECASLFGLNAKKIKTPKDIEKAFKTGDTAYFFSYHKPETRSRRIEIETTNCFFYDGLINIIQFAFIWERTNKEEEREEGRLFGPLKP